MNKYTDEEIDFVIDRLDLGFMRNIIKSDKSGVDWIMGSFAGKSYLLMFRLNKIARLVFGGK